jgi:hypothetical protein
MEVLGPRTGARFHCCQELSLESESEPALGHRMCPTLWILWEKRVGTEDLAGRQPGRLTVDDQDIQPDSLVRRSSRTQPLSGSGPLVRHVQQEFP